jgi:hypothetical protein
MTDDSVAAEYSIPPCRFCGLVHPYSGDDECDEQWAATLGLAIRRFVRRAEVERLSAHAKQLARDLSHATDYGVSVFAPKHDSVVDRLAALALEER